MRNWGIILIVMSVELTKTMIVESNVVKSQDILYNVPRSRWMTHLHDRIQDMKIGDLVIPGTFASAAYMLGNNLDISVEHTLPMRLAELFAAKQKMIPVWEVQTGSLEEQLESGIRYLDLRVIAIKHHFYWHHGFVADRVECGINQIYNFASQNPKEILILSFSNFYQRDNDSIRRSVSNETLERFADLLIKYLHGDLVPPTLGTNPSIREILATHSNIMVLMKNCYIVSGKYRRYFWADVSSDTIYNSVGGKTSLASYTREELFLTTSHDLQRHRRYHSNQLTTVLLYVQATQIEQLGVLLWEIWLFAVLVQVGLIALYNHHCFVPRNHHWRCCCDQYNVKYKWQNHKRKKDHQKIYLIVFLSNVLFLYSMQSDPGASGLLQNNRDSDNSDDNCSFRLIFQSDINHMKSHWLSRPTLYKCNVLLVTHFHTSTVVESAIQFALGLARKEVSVSYVGSPIAGYTGIRSWFSCPPALASYLVISRDEGRAITWGGLMEKDTVSFYEGQYPMDAMIFLSVGSATGKWFLLHSGNVQHWIDAGLDFYIRATESRTGRGRAYISYNHNDITWTCLSFPTGPTRPQQQPSRILNKITWDGNTPATFQHKPSSSVHPNIFQKLARG